MKDILSTTKKDPRLEVFTPEYHFLWGHDNGEFINRDNIMMLGIGGSYAYGVANEKSDVDVRGVVENTLESMIGIDQGMKHPKSLGVTGNGKDVSIADVSIYPFKAFVRQLIEGRVNAIELLALPDDCIIATNSHWDSLVGCRQLFLTNKAIHSYLRYVNSCVENIGRQTAILSHREDGIRQPVEYTKSKIKKELYTAFRLYYTVLNMFSSLDIEVRLKSEQINIIRHIRNGAGQDKDGKPSKETMAFLKYCELLVGKLVKSSPFPDELDKDRANKLVMAINFDTIYDVYKRCGSGTLKFKGDIDPHLISQVKNLR